MRTHALLQSVGPLAAVTPRWEWRVFDRFPSAMIAALAAQRPDAEVSREIYLLSATSPHNAKIRRGVLELKLLLDTTGDGFELWRPVVKQAFPATPAALAVLWDALSIAAPTLARDTYTEAQFMEALATTPITAVRVSKCRRSFDIQGCIAERAFLTIGEHQSETIALEHESLAKLRLTRASLPQISLTPTDYPAWLKHVVGIHAERLVQNGVSV